MRAAKAEEAVVEVTAGKGPVYSRYSRWSRWGSQTEMYDLLEFSALNSKSAPFGNSTTTHHPYNCIGRRARPPKISCT